MQRLTMTEEWLQDCIECAKDRVFAISPDLSSVWYINLLYSYIEGCLTANQTETLPLHCVLNYSPEEILNKKIHKYTRNKFFAPPDTVTVQAE